MDFCSLNFPIPFDPDTSEGAFLARFCDESVFEDFVGIPLTHPDRVARSPSPVVSKPSSAPAPAADPKPAVVTKSAATPKPRPRRSSRKAVVETADSSEESSEDELAMVSAPAPKSRTFFLFVIFSYLLITYVSFHRSAP